MGSYTKQYDDKVEVIMTECDFYSADGKKIVHTDRAVWDTGATTTIICRRLIDELKPEPFRKGGVSGIGGNVEVETYLVHIAPPTGDVVTYIEVMAHDFEDYDAIIGMDVITYGNFHIDNIEGKTAFSFSLT